MPNVNVEGPVLTVPCNPNLAIEDASELPLSMLIAREAAERAAAKNSGSVAARRVHQEMAQLYAARRRSAGSGND